MRHQCVLRAVDDQQYYASASLMGIKSMLFLCYEIEEKMKNVWEMWGLLYLSECILSLTESKCSKQILGCFFFFGGWGGYVGDMYFAGDGWDKGFSLSRVFLIWFFPTFCLRALEDNNSVSFHCISWFESFYLRGWREYVSLGLILCKMSCNTQKLISVHWCHFTLI